MKNLIIGNEANLIKLLVKEIEIKPYCTMKNGIINDAIYVKINNYNLENLLCQMIDDYGQEILIQKIKSL